ncbi:MAG: COX15/CtaA family protein [Flavobacteriaceae bacterium]
MKRLYRKMAKTSLVLVYLVIIAGAVVRMTGSGMGCPDWPKCFGYYIPPTAASELEWHAGKEYKKGQVIILNETLWVAKTDFNSSESYDSLNWEQYTRHDYATFNAFHTWTEFINRLFGALAGLAVLFMAIASFGYWPARRMITVMSWVAVFAMGFQGWLGATVVYSVLEPVKITLHMSMALVIVALLLFLIFKSGDKPKITPIHPLIPKLVILALLLSIIQIVMGTQVRQFVDQQIDLLGEHAKNQWLSGADLSFYIHRSFSIVVFFTNVFLAYLIYKKGMWKARINLIMIIILAEIMTGMAMYYLDFPFGSQAVHLILAAVLFGLQFYLLLESRGTVKSS